MLKSPLKKWLACNGVLKQNTKKSWQKGGVFFLQFLENKDFSGQKCAEGKPK